MILNKAVRAVVLIALSAAAAPSAYAQETGPAADRPVPVSIAAGYGHALAVWSDGSAAGWGFNKQGQVGDGTSLDQYIPKRLSSLPRLKQVAAGRNDSFGLARDGSVWAWGDNYSAYTGEQTGLYYSRSLPSKLEGISGAVSIASGGFLNAAVLGNGKVKLWYPEFDAATNTRSIGYLDLEGVDSAKSVAVGSGEVYVLRQDGSVLAVNTYNPVYGRIRTENELKITKLPLSAKIKALAASGRQLFLLQADGSVLRCDRDRQTVVKVAGLEHLIDIQTAYNQLLGLKSDGTVWQWNYTAVHVSKPAQVKGLEHIIRLAGSQSDLHLAIRKDGKLFLWGDSFFNRAGVGLEGGQAAAASEAPREWVQPLSWQVNGQAVAFAATPTVYENELYVPYVSVFESLGIRLSRSGSAQDKQRGNASSSEWKLDYQGKSIVFKTSDPAEVFVNGKRVRTAAKLRSAANSTQFPLESICRTFGIAMEWNRTTGLVSLRNQVNG